MAEHPVVQAVARVLADACPTPDQCAPTHDECMRTHPVHWLGLGPSGVGEQSITVIEGSPAGVAAVAAPAVLRRAAEMWDALAERIAEAPTQNLGMEWDRYQQQEQAVGVAEWLRNQAAEIERTSGPDQHHTEEKP